MSDIQEQIEAIEKEIRETPYHKATEHHIGKLRAKVAKLRDKQHETAAKKRGGGRGGYSVKKQGDATIVLVGSPSVGKSTLLNKLTNAKSKIAPYEFTTVTVIPGMMVYRDAQIQILDVPGLIRGAEKGKGKGREVLSVARGADLLIILCDVERKVTFENIVSSLEKSGLRINKKAPKVIIEKKVRGGIIIHANIKQDLSRQTIKDVAQELGAKNAEITIKEKLTMDRLIDAFAANRVYIPSIFVLNKSDIITKVRGVNLNHPSGGIIPTPLTYLLISAQKGSGLSELKEKIWQELRFIRVYLVQANEKPSRDHPIVVKKGQTLNEVAKKIGTEFVEGKTRAKIWGTDAKYPGQEVSLKTPVAEGMQIRFVYASIVQAILV